MKDKIIADGLTAQELINRLHTRDAAKAAKSLAYFDGKQEEELIRLLDDPVRGRSNWRRKGIHPRTRNILRMIVEKSGLLFKDKFPNFSVYRSDVQAPDEALTTTLNNVLAASEFQDTLIHLDSLTRLLRTTILLIQWDGELERFYFDVLTRADADVVINPVNKQISTLIYRMSEYDETSVYVAWTPDTVFTIVQSKAATTITEEPNPYGIVPAVAFHDTCKPRSGFWVTPDTSLVGLNELYNLNLTDSEYAIAWAKRPTLFSNMKPAESSDFAMSEVFDSQPSVKQQLMNASTSFGGTTVEAGPESVVLVESNGIEQPLLEYKSPQVDLKSIEDVVNNWVQNFAYDFSVRVNVAGNGSVSSGFQLVVEELPNLELRQTRQRMFEAYASGEHMLTRSQHAGFILPRVPSDAAATR